MLFRSQLSPATIGTPAAGVLTTSWNGPATDEAVLRISGTALRDGLLSESFYLRKDYTPAAAYTTTGVVQAVALQFDAPSTAAATLFNSRPNPFRDQTELRFQLPAAGKAALDVYDASGRRIWSREAAYTAGLHTVVFERPAGTAAGVLICRLRTDNGVQTQRLVVE